jgi:hypothetical protein
MTQNDSEILTCVLCGRRGVKDYEPLPASGWRCGNQQACQRRQRETAEQDTSARHTHATPAGQTATNAGDAAGVAAVAGLAREVEGVRRDLARELESLRPLPEQVARLAGLVERLAEDVAAQAARHTPAGAPSWLDLPAEFDVAAAVLGRLVEWLGEVFLRYQDAGRALPACWMWHPDVVEELLWLMHTWLAAYRSDAATAQAAGDWHDRYRPGVVKRIKAAAGTCSLENHQPRDGRLPGGPAVPLATALEPIADWWATRATTTPPEPTDDQYAAQQLLDQQRQTRRGRAHPGGDRRP